MSVDNFTSTVDGAAGFEYAAHGDDYYDDRPTLAECQRDEAMSGGTPTRPRCTTPPRTNADGSISTCNLRDGHGGTHNPEREPWSAPAAWLDEPPF